MPFSCASPHRVSAFAAGLAVGFCLVFVLSLSATSQAPSADPDDFIEGHYWALIIGINKYPTMDKDKQLTVARNGAEVVAKLLKERYGFSGKRMLELYDEAASRKGIIRACSSMKRRLTDKDSLFIYYAGRGEYESTGKDQSGKEKRDGMGYWIPSDAELDDPSSYIFNSQIRDYAANIPARHIFMVVDSVFSGSLMGRPLPAPRSLTKELYQRKSRWILASGGFYLSPFPEENDKRKFASSFMRILGANTNKYLSVSDFYTRGACLLKLPPCYDDWIIPVPIISAGDEGGQFVFRLRPAKVPSLMEAVFTPFKAPKANDLAQVVMIPAGEFIMGSELGKGQPDESPQRKVYLDAYAIDKYEVTVAQYAGYLRKAGGEPPDFWDRINQKEDMNRPVVGVDWLEADEYCRFYGKRLPTEAQWEKAARGTDGRKYPWGDEDPGPQFANFANGVSFSYSKSLAPVGSYEAGKSPFGVYDMVGNVWEWVNDWYRKDYYQVAPAKNPAGPDIGDYVVIRGGSWAIRPAVARSAGRMFLSPNTRSNSLGFRCAGEAR